MSEHRSPLAPAILLCLISLLLSGTAFADSDRGAAPQSALPSVSAERVVQPQNPAVAAEPTSAGAAANGAEAAKPQPDLGLTKPLGNVGSTERRAPFWNTQRSLGVAAAALGLVGIGISTWYAVQNGQPTGSADCRLGELPNQPCRYNTTDQFAFGFAASNLGLALGIALFSSAHLF